LRQLGCWDRSTACQYAVQTANMLPSQSYSSGPKAAAPYLVAPLACCSSRQSHLLSKREQTCRPVAQLCAADVAPQSRQEPSAGLTGP
jgi:hypothetical protein